MSGLLAALRQVAAGREQHVAVRDASRQWTYRELAAQARSVAATLQASGVRAGDLVLLSMRPDGAGIAAMWGCWLAGASFVPIEQRAQQHRNRRVAELTGARVVLADRPVQLPGLATVTVTRTPAVTGPVEPVPVAADPGYVLFTSGSTGTPNGVAVNGEALLAHCRAVIEFEGLTPEWVVSQFHELTFDPPQQYLWSGLLAGATVVAKPAGTVPPHRFAGFLAEHRVHSVGVATRYLAILAGVGVLEEDPPPALRALSVGGEALPVGLACRFQRSRWAGVQLINYYGPTEGVVAVTGYRLPPGWTPHPEARSVPVGEPLGARRIELRAADGEGLEQPGSATGELVVLGQPRALGYLGTPDAHRFSGSGDRAQLRTGDLAVYRPGQGYEILGRLDDQVKVAGYRIDLGEVEHALRTVPGVADLAVVALRAEFDTSLGACLVVEAGADAEQVLAAVRQRAADLLPYQRPGRYLLADALPLTGNGKTDRARLATELSGLPERAGPGSSGPAGEARWAG
jgi:acyl-coenzyme A synthetase/AMP-(fatty) acid ligase